jgi:hypothetical protein
MYLRNSQWSRLFEFGILLAIAGLIFLTLRTTNHPILRAIAASSLLIGVVLYHLANYVLFVDRSALVQGLRQNATWFFWTRVLTVVLWLGAIPLVFLWLYDRLHRLR